MVGSLLQRQRKAGTISQRRYGCVAKDAAKVACGCGRVFRDAGVPEMFVAQQVIAEYENPEILAQLDRGNDNAERIAGLQHRIETTAGNLDAETDRRTEVLTGVGDADDLRVIDRTIAGLKIALKTLRAEQDSVRGAPGGWRWLSGSANQSQAFPELHSVHRMINLRITRGAWGIRGISGWGMKIDPDSLTNAAVAIGELGEAVKDAAVFRLSMRSAGWMH
ncbi:hypothetical protein [Nocardia sp. NPDC006630]|uniref:hypothetical protein n=1 Tax=Nocardia sp. NPDC006630 TaxID=3157181 RepID=UPI0033BC19E4